MSRLAAGVFAALVVATFGAFFVAQRLKNSPSVVQQFRLGPFFSPNRDGRFERAYVTFKLKRADDVTVAVVNAEGDVVRRLASRRIAAYTPVRFGWDGRTDDGARAPDGTYRVRITLRTEGRSITIMNRSTRLDVTPPRPLVTSIGPEKGPGPELLPLPKGGPLTVHLRAPGRRPIVRVFKTGPGPLKLAREEALPDGAKTWDWDGTTKSGRRLSPGTYLVSIEVRDQAGNRGVSPPLGRNGLPRTPYGGRLPGRGGVTIRYLGVQPPSAPVAVGAGAEFGIDARKQPWTWTLRRVGSTRVLKRGRKTSARLRVTAPGGRSGAYLLTVRTARHRATVPFAIQSKRASRRVLVVLPVMTWQGRNPVDDDGDGLPNLLDRGTGAKLARVYAGDGLPAGFATRDAPLLAWLDRTNKRYDVTTDAALARNTGPTLSGHRAVLLPSDVRWLPRSAQVRLRRFVRGGGRLGSLGVDSLRREVSLTKRNRMVDPTAAASIDLFGAKLRPPLLRAAKPVTLVDAGDDIQLFLGTNGQFGPFAAYQELESPGGSKLVAGAVTQEPLGDHPVIAATRTGKGLVIRLPLPQLPSKLSARAPDPQAVALLQR
ncbi:MAG: FlgD immunoglobulin-like domain containing protein, partial [Solirubrobacteraceae bacterium]